MEKQLCNVKMDEVPLNNSPDLTMEEITKLLFNNQFMSDIQFLIGGKVIHAHSWEVMKRSIVFRQQFRTNLGDNKLIPIKDASYEAFYQFLRFIYTDQCNIEESLICDMLKLAVRYKIVKLETKLLNMSEETSNDTDLKLLEFSVLNQYELSANTALENILGCITAADTKSTPFVNIHLDALEAILKSDYIPDKMAEVDLFEGLVHWMYRTCGHKQISLDQRRLHFDKLIRLIRFPAMDPEDFRLCLKNQPNLFTNDDIVNIVRQNAFNDKTDQNHTWITKPRLEYQSPVDYRTFPISTKWVTKFTVSDHLILRGIQYGLLGLNMNYEIHISSKNRITNITDKLSFKFESVNEEEINTISLGESIKLSSNFDYSIEIIYLPTLKDADKYVVLCRKPKLNVVVTGPSKLVTLSTASENLFELHFIQPPPK